MKKKYQIVKEMIVDGKSTFVLITDGLSQIYETSNKKKADNVAEMFNINSDSGWTYSVRQIG